MPKQAFDVTLEDVRGEAELTDLELDGVAGGTGQFRLAPEGNSVPRQDQKGWSDLVPFGSLILSP